MASLLDSSKDLYVGAEWGIHREHEDDEYNEDDTRHHWLRGKVRKCFHDGFGDMKQKKKWF